MDKSVAVVGAGINGLLTAFLVRESYPDTNIHIFDAEKHPANVSDHRGITHGSKDARHITGSESIGFENSVHRNALRNNAQHKARGWLLKDETQLTPSEKKWRDEFEATYKGADGLNDIDFAHAALNYSGLAAWQKLATDYPCIAAHMINTDGVDVYFRSKAAFEDDVMMETEFCTRYCQGSQVEISKNQEFDRLYSKKLVVPGMSIRIKSLALDLLKRLEKDKRVTFHWGVTVKTASHLTAETIVWTSGITHEQPDEYLDHNVQGIVGCWVTTSNPGYTRPFKIATPTPSAYINFTPDGSELHISGGFGWTGEYIDTAATRLLAKPVAEHFVKQVNKYLGTNLTTHDVYFCTRPSTPTGQPLRFTTNSGAKKNIFIAGSAKSGTTHAPMLSEYVLKQLGN